VEGTKITKDTKKAPQPNVDAVCSRFSFVRFAIFVP
jgi:hypothetical protein